ncbi:MAG: NYN domain-containing protein [Planctomycetes bacterium]|nr:NYN domain-containing protein [Planctomycetota bacterium]
MYVVDGYNLLHALKKRPDGLPSDFGRARARMCELLSGLARVETQVVRMFFDGTHGELSPGDLAFPRVRVTFCGPGVGAADRAVREFVENSREPGKLRVISSDIEVVQACKLAGAKVISSQDMAARLGGARRDAPAGGAEKPIRGMVGKLEQEMLDEIGDFDEFERRILGE